MFELVEEGVEVAPQGLRVHAESRPLILVLAQWNDREVPVTGSHADDSEMQWVLPGEAEPHLLFVEHDSMRAVLVGKTITKRIEQHWPDLVRHAAPRHQIPGKDVI